MFWFDILSNAEKDVDISFGKDQKIRISSQSREHLFSVWLKDEEECKIVVNGDKEIVLELPKDISMETTCDIEKTIVKTRRTRRSLTKDDGCIYDLLCRDVGSITCKARTSKSSSNNGCPWNGQDVSRLFDDFKISKSNNDVPLDVLATTSNEDGEVWTCFPMLRESAAMSMFDYKIPTGVGCTRYVSFLSLPV